MKKALTSSAFFIGRVAGGSTQFSDGLRGR
jgi:hypothetical protein